MPASVPRPGWLAPVLLVAAILLAYANALRAPFLFDDADAVLNNPTIRSLASLDVLRPPADGSTTTGIGLYLNNTRNHTFSWMQLNDCQNFGIYHMEDANVIVLPV